MSDQCIFLWLL